MAYFRLQNSEEINYLREHHTIGRRANEVDTLLDFPFVSKLHAIIEWKAPHWVIRDMSSNGTLVNGHRLPPYSSQTLSKGDVIEIAGNEGPTLEMLSIGEPVDMIYVSDKKLVTQSLTENRLLPDQERPLIELYKCPERQQWFAHHIGENDDQQIELGPFEHNSQLQCGDVKWTFFIVNDSDKTVAIESIKNDIQDVEFRFDLSQDEENTTLTLMHGSREVDLHERTHHYLLAHLLRHKKEQEINTDGDQESLGWMNCKTLIKDLGIDETYMNILVFRARQQITSALVGYSGSSRLFERRRGAIRSGILNFSIYKEGKKEI